MRPNMWVPRATVRRFLTARAAVLRHDIGASSLPAALAAKRQQTFTAAWSLRRSFCASGARAAEGGFVGEGMLRSLGWLPQQITIDRDTADRKSLMAASFSNHLALGSAFTFSLWVPQLTKLQGTVVQSSGDWLMGDVTPAFSLM